MTRFGSALALGIALAANAWQMPLANDGLPHGDAPYLLEPGWLPLSDGKSLSGWRYEHAEKGKWSTSPGVFWHGTGEPKQLIAYPAWGIASSMGPKARCRISSPSAGSATWSSI